MTVRFLHTADWQLGHTPQQLGDTSARARETRFETAEKVVGVAEQESVDFVIVAGDTFENEDLDRATVGRVVDIFEALEPIPIYVLPGNHDPIRPGGIWDAIEWENRGEHMHLLERRVEVEVEDGVVLYPCPLKQKQSRQDPTAWIPERASDDDRIRIGVAHGSRDVLPDDSPNFPIPSDRAAQSGLDYLALGDWHGLSVNQRTAYPGTIEQTSFGEEEPGHALVVEVSSGEEDPQIKPTSVGQLHWRDVKEALLDETDVDALRAELEREGDIQDLVARLELEAAREADPVIADAVEALDDEFGSDAFYWSLSFDESSLYEERELEIPDGILSEVNEDLAAIVDGKIPDGPGSDFADEDREVVEEARRLLFDVVDNHSQSQ